MQKEYLQKLEDGSYKLVVLSGVVDGHKGLIEVPEGAEMLMVGFNTSRGIAFYKDGMNLVHGDNGYWEKCYKQDINKNAKIVWKRGEEAVKGDVDETLGERQSQYGSFKDVAGTTQYLLQMLSNDSMSDVQLEALHMICSKLARITHGDVNHVDSWHDIAGYATLVVNELENK